jgi:hypothetical protein
MAALRSNEMMDKKTGAARHTSWDSGRRLTRFLRCSLSLGGRLGSAVTGVQGVARTIAQQIEGQYQS